jgi:hypothetical protein
MKMFSIREKGLKIHKSRSLMCHAPIPEPPTILAFPRSGIDDVFNCRLANLARDWPVFSHPRSGMNPSGDWTALLSGSDLYVFPIRSEIDDSTGQLLNRKINRYYQNTITNTNRIRNSRPDSRSPEDETDQKSLAFWALIWSRFHKISRLRYLD